MIHLVTDIFDPSKGSEFQLAQKALHALMRHTQGKVCVWTTRRGDNEDTIRSWLKEQGYSTRVNVICIRMPRANALGHHRSRFDFMRDLMVLYKAVKQNTSPQDFIWKCGQANFLFNLVFLAHCKADLLGPLSGFEIPIITKVRGLGLGARLYYLCYATIILLGRLVFHRSLKRNPTMNVLVATHRDRLAIHPLHQNRVFKVSEIDSEGILNSALQADRLPDSQGHSLLLWSGALISRKNPLLALEILQAALAREPHLTALMIGEGPLGKVLQHQWEQLPAPIRSRLSIRHALPREEFRTILASASALLVTSLREANSVLVYEALAQRIPVVASSVSGLTDSVAGAGYLYALEDPEVVKIASQALLQACRQKSALDSAALLWQEVKEEMTILETVVRKRAA